LDRGGYSRSTNIRPPVDAFPVGVISAKTRLLVGFDLQLKVFHEVIGLLFKLFQVILVEHVPTCFASAQHDFGSSILCEPLVDPIALIDQARVSLYPHFVQVTLALQVNQSECSEAESENGGDDYSGPIKCDSIPHPVETSFYGSV
jgi:hypothetical protein